MSANLLSPTALLAGRPDFTSTWILLRVCYLALVLLSCFAGIHPLWAATHLQQASLSDVTSKTYTSVSVTFPVATTTGNAIILGLSFGNINPVITATDSQGNTYFQAIKTYDSNHRQGCAILYATNIVGGASTRVTLQFSSSVAYIGLAIHEYSGIAASAALDVTVGRIGSGSSVSSGSAITRASGDLIFGSAVEDAIGHSDTFIAGSGFALRTNLANAAGYADEDLVQTSAGSIAASWTLSPASSWIAEMAAFRSSTSSPPDPGPPAAPAITALSPRSGPVGTSVTISGANFGTTQDTSTVVFNGTPAAPTSWSANSIVAPVPNGATSGNVTVTVGGQVSNGVTFSVTNVTVLVSPAASTLQVNQSANFSATVQNDPLNRGVTWSVSGDGCSGFTCGTLSGATANSVTYTAPANVPNPSRVVLAATSVADGARTASAMITVAQSSGSSSLIPTFADNHVSASGTTGYNTSSYTLRLPNGTQPGNCVIVGFQYAPTPGATPVITDDRGNTYTVVASHDDGHQVANLAFALNVAAGAQKITLAFTGVAPPYVSALASEFYNIAGADALDGRSGSSGASGTVNAGTLTSATSGDLIYQYAVQDSTSDPMISWTQGNSWTLLSADLFDGTAAQYQVQASAGSINPTLGMAPSQNFNSVAIALKPAINGNAPPPGIRVARVQHSSIPAWASSPVRLQFPSTGNLLVVDWIGVEDHDITAITDGNNNTYTSTGAPFGRNQSGDNQIFYAASATTSTTMTGPVLTTTGTDISGSTAILFDVIGAASSPYDTIAGRATASGLELSGGSVTAASITPTRPNSLVITSIGVNSNTINGVSPGNFLSVLPEPIASPNPVDQNNGWGLYYAADARPITFVWSSEGGQLDDWASIAVVFNAP